MTTNVTLIPVDLASLTMHGAVRLAAHAECVLCGSSMMAGLTIYDGDDCYCSACGAVDHWIADEDGVYLARAPDDGPTICVLRDVFETPEAAREWAQRARNDPDVNWLVDQGRTP